MLAKLSDFSRLTVSVLSFLLFSYLLAFSQETPGYVQVVRDIFIQTCLNCHNSAKSGAERNGAPSDENFDTYTLAAVYAGQANTRIQAGTMPPTGPLSDTQKSLMQSWVNAGTPLGEVVDYNDMRESIFNPICLNCHSSDKSGSARNGAPSDENFDTYEAAVVYASKANARVQAGTMPPTGPLTDTQKTLFQDWVYLGTPSGETVYYTQLKESIFDGFCLNCHASTKTGAQRNGAPENANFDTYPASVASANKANNRIQAGTMPPTGPLNDEQQLLFFNWIYSGTPEKALPVCDFNSDSALDISDVITLILLIWNNPEDPAADFNGDGIVNISDAVSLLITIRYGKCAETGSMLASAGYFNPVSRVENLSREQVKYLEEVIGLLGLTEQEEAAFRLALYGNAGKSALPRAFILKQNSPNPFNPATTISYSVPEGRIVKVIINVYDLRGKLVRSMVNQERGAGIYNVFWDGTDEAGRKMPSGVYLYRMSASEFTQTRKMVVLK